MLVDAVDDGALSPDFPLGDALEVFALPGHVSYQSRWQRKTPSEERTGVPSLRD